MSDFTAKANIEAALPCPHRVGRTRLCRVLRASGLLALGLCCYSALHGQVILSSGQGTVPGAGFSSPQGVAVDKAGDIFIADTNNNRVVEISGGTGPQITLPANGLAEPTGVAVDAAGNVFIADGVRNNRVVELPAGGGAQITVGTGLNDPYAVAVDSAGNLFIADVNNNRIVEVPSGGGVQTIVAAVGLLQPNAVAVDGAGDVFISDAGNNRIVEVLAGGAAQVVTPVAGGGFDELGIAVDGAGNVFLSGELFDGVVEFPAGGGAQVTLPIATPNPFSFQGLAVDGSGHLFVTNYDDNAVYELQFNSVNFGGVNVCPAGQVTPAPCTETLTLNYNVAAGVAVSAPVVTTGGAAGLDFTVAPNSTCGTVAGTTCVVNVIFTPSAVGVREGAVTVTEAADCLRFPCNLPHATTMISGTGLAPEAAIFGILFQKLPATASLDLTGVAVDGAGNYYYSDQGGNTVYKVTNGVTTPVGFTGLNAPQQLAIDGSGAIYVLTGGSQIIELAANGVQTTLLSTLTALTPNLEAYLENIGAFAIDAQGNIYVGGPAGGSGTGEVVKFDTSGNLTVVGTGYASIQSMTVGPGGTVYLVDFNAANGTSTVSTIGAGDQQGTLAIALPPISAIAVDAGGSVYLAEDSETPPFTLANLLVFDATGVETNYGMAEVDIPNQMAITPTGGFYIANQSGSQTGNPSGSIFFYSRDATGGFEFNTVPVGSISPAFPTPVLNVGNEPLTIFGLTYVGPFSEAPVANSIPKECAATLAAGATCVITDVFSPPAPDSYQGSFTLTDNSLNTTAAAPATQTYDLFGTGAGQPVTMTLSGPTASVAGGPLNTFLVAETDADGNAVAGDNNLVNFVITGPQEYNFLSTTLANGTGTLTQALVEPGTYSVVATDAVNALTATDNFTIPNPIGPGLNYVTIGLALNPTTPYYFDNSILTVTVTGQNVPPPTGTISYSVDNGQAQTATLISVTGAGPTTLGVALGQLAIGAHSVSVTYNGDPATGFYLASGPEVLDFTVTDAPLTFLSSQRNVALQNGSLILISVAVDSAGNVYLGDGASGNVLKYDQAGNQTTVQFPAGFQPVDPVGLAVDAGGDLFVSDSESNEVFELLANGTAQRLSQQLTGLIPAAFSNPGKVTIGPGGVVYVADTGNARVLKFVPGQAAALVPTNGGVQAVGVATDSAGNLYMGVPASGQVLKLDTSGNQTIFSQIEDPVAITVDAANNVYVVDGEFLQLFRIDSQGHQIQVSSANIASGIDVATDNLGNFFLASTGSSFFEVTTNSGIKFPDDEVAAPASTALANYLIPSADTVPPTAVATDLAANTEFQATSTAFACFATGSQTCSYLASFQPNLPGSRSGSFTLSDANGAVLRTDSIYGNGLAPLAAFDPFSYAILNATGLLAPGAIAVDSAGTAYVADAGNGSIFKVPAGGAPVSILAGLTIPAGVAVDGIGNVYTIDSQNTFVKKIDPLGNVTNLVNDLTQPSAIVVDGGGNLFVGVSAAGAGEVLKIDPLGNETPFVQDLASVPTALALDSAGNLYVPGDGVILKVTPFKSISPITFNAEVSALAVDAAGEIYAVDPETQQIVRLDTAGNLTNQGNIELTIGGIALDGFGDIFFTSANPVGLSEVTRGSDGINFEDQAVGSTSAAYTFTATNVGNEPLGFSGLTVPAGFALETPQTGLTACSGTLTLAAGIDCSLPIAFTPTAVGAVAETAILTSNSLNAIGATEGVILDGTGTAVGVTPTSISITGPATGVSGQTGTYTITELGAGGVAATGDSDVVIVSVLGASSQSQVTLANGVGTLLLTYALGQTGLIATDETNTFLTQTFALTVTPSVAPTTLALALVPAAPTTADPVSVVVTLGGDNPTLPATGTISYTLDGVASPTTFPVGVPNSPGAYVVSVPLGRLAVGPHAFTASYSGDANYAGAGPAALPLSIAPLVVTTTALAITAGGAVVTMVASATAVTLTATVTVDGDFVSPGLVTFCDATATFCEGSAILGTAQLTTAGTAALKFIPGIGAHSYKAVFAGTNVYAGSASAAGALTVTGLYPTVTTIAASGTVGDYTLTGTVVGTGSAAVSPSGNISFLDTSNGNVSLGTAELGAAAPGLGFVQSANPAAGGGFGPGELATGDFNGDGIADVAVASSSANTVTILLGKGDGTFAAAAVSPATGSQPVAIVAGDFNGDGKTDLAVANDSDQIVSVTVLLGNGDGTFTTSNVGSGAGYGPAAIAVGDFNGDGISDLAVTLIGNDTVLVLLGNGDGTFTAAAASPSTGSQPDSLVVGDFNGDGNADLAIANSSDDTVTILLGNGDGTFVAAQTSPATGAGPFSLAVGDYNGDGKADLAVSNYFSNSVTVLLGNGDGTFAATVMSPATGNEPISILTADFNGDGKADLGVANNDDTVTILLANGDGTFSPSSATPSAGLGSGSLAAADFNGDGVPDLAESNSQGINTVTILLTQRTQTATATLANLSLVGAGTHSVAANYGGIANLFLPSLSSTTVALTGSQTATTLTLTATPVNSTFGQTVTMTATLGAGVPTATATGNVTFFAGATALGTAPLTGGVATFATGTLALGGHTLTASYDGDANFAASTSLLFSVNVGVGANTLSFAPDPLAFMPVGDNGGVVTVTLLGVGTGVPTVTLVVTGPNAYSVTYGPVNVVNGAASFDTTANALTVAGLYTYTATSPGGLQALATQTLVPTSFGLASNGQPVGTSTDAQTVTLVFNQPTILAAGANAIEVVTRGALNLDFTPGPTQDEGACVAGATYSAGQICTESVIFTPTAPGLRLGAVVLSGTLPDNDDAPVEITAFLSGVGTGPLVDFGGALPSTLLTAPTVSAPEGIAVDAAGNVFIADSPNQAVLELPAGGGAPTTLNFGELSFPVAVAVDGAGSVYVVDQNGDGNNVFELQAGSAQATVVYDNVDTLSGIAVDGAGNVYIADQTANSIVKVPAVGGSTIFVAGTAGLNAPQGLAVDAAGDLFVADSGNNRVVELAAGAATLTPLATGLATPPNAVAVDAAGDLFITESQGNVLVETNAVGVTQATFTQGIGAPLGVALDGLGNLYVASPNTFSAVKFLRDVALPLTFATQAAGSASAPQPVGVQNNGNLPLVFSAITEGTNAALDAASTTCSITSSVAVGGACNLGVEFSPAITSVSGTQLNGTVTLADNAPNTPQTVSLTGVSLLDAAIVTSTIGFGAGIPYGPYSVTATVTGAVAGLPVPTGSLGYTIDGAATVAIPGALVNGSIVFQLPQIAVGNHTIGFAYSGDVHYPGTPNDIVPTSQYVAFSITPAPLTVTASSLTSVYGQVLPTLTDTITGFAYNDTAASAVTGVPALTTTATTASVPGSYPITAASGTLAAANYTFQFVPGTLTVSQAPQTLTLAPIANVTYGAPAFSAAGTSTSGLPVTVSVQSGPATAANNLVSITGVGTVVLTATQAGNADYLAATFVTASFTVNPATLTVTANAASSVFGQPLPNFTDTITGFVYSDSAATAITGTPTLSTTATAGGAPGSYPITVAKGSLAAANYIFSFAPGTLTITPGTQTITFAAIPAQTYGAAAYTVAATSTSGLPVIITVQSGPATIANNQVTANGVGTVVLAASQAGDADYSAAPIVTTSFVVNPASTSIALSASSSEVRTPSPISLSATVTSDVPGETGTVTFLDGTTTLGQSPLSATDSAALNGVTLAVGSHTITAKYSGAVDFGPSASAAATVVVEPLGLALNAIVPNAVAAGSSDTTITATGANFSPTAIVNFNSAALATTFVSATQLTAVIPAAQLVSAGTANVTVTDTYSSSASVAQTFTILPPIAVTFSGPPTTTPGQQPTLNFTLQQAYPSALNGIMTLTFTPDPGSPDNPEVQFATGGRTFNFTLPPNTTDTPLILLQAGTTSGTITVTLQLTSGGVNVTPSSVTPIAIVVPKVAPTVSAVSFSASADVLTVVVTGYSSTREIQSATFSFTPANGATLNEKTLTVPATTLFATWYTTAGSSQYGSAFTYTQLFTLSGPATDVGGVGVSLTNSVGTSTEVTAP
jgi:sugar lactone lactonase YvrE